MAIALVASILSVIILGLASVVGYCIANKYCKKGTEEARQPPAFAPQQVALPQPATMPIAIQPMPPVPILYHCPQQQPTQQQQQSARLV